MAHFFAAAGYSIAGIRRLWQETAFRHEVLAFVLVIAGLFWLGASFAEMGVMVVLFLALVAMEALNTAIECLVDHLTSDWAEFAKHAKDLGSLAVMCLLLANGAALAVIVVGHLASV